MSSIFISSGYLCPHRCGTGLPKHGGALYNKFLISHPMIHQCCLASAIVSRMHWPGHWAIGPSSSSCYSILYSVFWWIGYIDNFVFNVWNSCFPQLIIISNIVVPDRVYCDSKVYVRPIMYTLVSIKAINQVWIKLNIASRKGICNLRTSNKYGSVTA
jgi:hypothetical protein